MDRVGKEAGPCIHFLLLPQMITQLLVAWNNTDGLSYGSAGQKSNLGCMGLMSGSLAGSLSLLIQVVGRIRPLQLECWGLVSFLAFLCLFAKPQLLSGICKTIDNVAQSRLPDSSFISPTHAFHPLNAPPLLLCLVRRDITAVTPLSCLLSPLIISSLSLQHFFPSLETPVCACASPTRL